MNVAALVVGTDGWLRQTKPLVDAVHLHEPECAITLIDNGSADPYPQIRETHGVKARTVRLEQRSPAAVSVTAAERATRQPEWYIILANNVRCTGPFTAQLEGLSNVVVGPQLMRDGDLVWLAGWCMAVPLNIWQAIGGWNADYLVSSWEDVDFCLSTIEHGYSLLHLPEFPFESLG